MNLFKPVYNLVLHVYACAMVPKMGWKCWRQGKYRKSFLPRLGIGFPKVVKTGRPLVWVHAVSLGETKAAAPLVEKLRGEFDVLFSTATETGYAEGKKSVAANYHAYLPFDLPYVIKPIVRRVAPDLLVLTETDFWCNLQESVKAIGGDVVLINGKISKRSYELYTRFAMGAKHLFQSVDLFCVQAELYKERFQALGVPADKIVVTGNIKLDGIMPKEAPLARSPDDFILTLGSTHAPEEEIWIRVLKQFPQIKVYLVPRHPERFDEVAALLTKEGIAFGRWSLGATFADYPWILVDAMGVLRRCYQISDLAFVGGSLTSRVGGHNILEPSFYGVPVLYGPHMQTQPDLLDLMQRYQAGIEVTQDTLPSILTRLFHNKEERVKLGMQGKRLLAESSGALAKTWEIISRNQLP